MFEIVGKYSTALITTDDIEDEAIAQVTALVNHPASLGSKIAIMPDVHAGKGCVVGTTMTINDRAVPNLVGVDIGCGVRATEIIGDLDTYKLQAVIDMYVPSGFAVNDVPNCNYFTYWPIMSLLETQLRTPLTSSEMDRIAKSVGTLGGGNHFISVEADEDGRKYLIVHTGSRSLGLKVAKYHQGVAEKNLVSDALDVMIAQMKAEGRHKEIDQAIKDYKAKQTDASPNKELAFLTGRDMADYLSDAAIAKLYAELNRAVITATIFERLGWKMGEVIETTHNYIGDDYILRKGAVDARSTFLVPLNMRDGTLICAGSDNEAWNFSGPHGAGRVLSRSKAKQTLSLEDFRQTMSGIASFSVGQSTLDEAPDAYKSADSIKGLVGQNYRILRHLKPLFNFKASDEVD